MHGMHCIKSYSKTQSNIALSSGEAEYYGAVKGAAILLGARSLAADLGHSYMLVLSTDASAAKGMASRTGLSSKTRHMDVQYLWLQEKVKAREISITKIQGKQNPADMLTKHLSKEEMVKFMKKCGLETRKDRHQEAPKV